MSTKYVLALLFLSLFATDITGQSNPSCNESLLVVSEITADSTLASAPQRPSERNVSLWENHDFSQAGWSALIAVEEEENKAKLLQAPEVLQLLQRKYTVVKTVFTNDCESRKRGALILFHNQQFIATNEINWECETLA